MASRRYLALGGFLAATFAAAAIGSAATFPSVSTWYPTLVRPGWTPPNGLFGPVWSALYVAMSIAAWRAWRRAEAPAARRTVVLYAAQLGLNALWSVLFFAWRRPGWALAEIVVLWVLLVVLLVRFARTDRIAAALWAPYVAWVSFAMALNAAIVWLNR